MNPLALEWVDKAEGDYATACREMRARLALNYDAVCFHSQQMAEKYLKAVLLGHSQPIPRIHSLARSASLTMCSYYACVSNRVTNCSNPI